MAGNRKGKGQQSHKSGGGGRNNNSSTPNPSGSSVKEDNKGSKSIIDDNKASSKYSDDGSVTSSSKRSSGATTSGRESVNSAGSGGGFDFTRVLLQEFGVGYNNADNNLGGVGGGNNTGSTTGSSASGANGGSASFRVSWKELIWLVLCILMLAGLSIFMGIAAGITISIHYFDTQGTTPSFPRMEARERYLTGSIQHVTTLDPSIVSNNIILSQQPKYRNHGDPNSHDGFYSGLGRVITTSESGQRNVLLVVEEAAPLDGIQGKQQQTNYPYSSSAQYPYSSPPPDQNQYNSNYYYHNNLGGPPNMEASQSKALPKLCSDGYTIGFDDWPTFKAAVEEANALSAERFMRWNEYFSLYYDPEETINIEDSFIIDEDNNYIQNPHHYSNKNNDYHSSLFYEEDVMFTICPGSTLRARRGPIFINAENVIIECGSIWGSEMEYNDMEDNDFFYGANSKNGDRTTRKNDYNYEESSECVIDVGGTHLTFGPHATNVLVRGVTFRRAHTSSLAFHYDGAQASFEDCIWIDNNQGVHGKYYGAVADINSTSTVNFYRCEIGMEGTKKKNNFYGAYGGSSTTSTSSMMAPGFASFLSLRA